MHLVMDLCSGGELFELVANWVSAPSLSSLLWLCDVASFSSPFDFWQLLATQLSACWICLQTRYSEQSISRLFRSILKVVKACHSMGICHRDLKPGARGHTGRMREPRQRCGR